MVGAVRERRWQSTPVVRWRYSCGRTGARKRDVETESGRSLAPLRPQLAVVGLDDRATNRQADACPLGLGRVEGLEYSTHRVLRNPDARISDLDVYGLCGVLGGPYQELTRTLLARVHGLDGIHDQIQ